MLVGCSTKSDSDKKTIYVTITPMQAIIDEITMGDFNVEVIVPKGASPAEYAKATGLEALLGALYLSGQTDRINQLFHIMMDI